MVWGAHLTVNKGTVCLHSQATYGVGAHLTGNKGTVCLHSQATL